jgi:hypothetical protein
MGPFSPCRTHLRWRGGRRRAALEGRGGLGSAVQSVLFFLFLRRIYTEAPHIFYPVRRADRYDSCAHLEPSAPLHCARTCHLVGQGAGPTCQPQCCLNWRKRFHLKINSGVRSKIARTRPDTHQVKKKKRPDTHGATPSVTNARCPICTLYLPGCERPGYTL